MTLAISNVEVIDAVSSKARKSSTRIATVDPSYSGTGDPRITFDGEATMSTKTYPYIGGAPRPGDRVTMSSIGSGWVITGSMTTPGATKTMKTYHVPVVEPPTFPVTAANIVLGNFTVPYPGWSYRLSIIGQAYFSAEGPRYLQARLDSLTGASASRSGLMSVSSVLGGGYGQPVGWPLVLATVFTAPQVVLLIAYTSFNAPMVDCWGAQYGGMTILQFPA
jgi:hypothetical protein